MKISHAVVAFACFLALLAGSCESLLGPETQPPPPIIHASRLATLLDSLRYALDLPALAGAIVTTDSIVDAQSVGCRRYGGAENVTVNDQFHLGSCGKAITATLLGVLVDEGRVSWNSTLLEIFPDLAASMRPEYRSVTLRDVLSHASGRMRLTFIPWWRTASRSGGASPQSSHFLYTGLCHVPATGTISIAGTMRCRKIS